MIITNKMVEKLKVVMLIDYSFRPSGKFYGYKYCIEFESLQGDTREYLTSSKKLFESLETGKTYKVEYIQTSDRCIAPASASIMVNMKNVKVIREV